MSRSVTCHAGDRRIGGTGWFASRPDCAMADSSFGRCTLRSRYIPPPRNHARRRSYQPTLRHRAHFRQFCDGSEFLRLGPIWVCRDSITPKRRAQAQDKERVKYAPKGTLCPWCRRSALGSSDGLAVLPRYPRTKPGAASGILRLRSPASELMHGFHQGGTRVRSPVAVGGGTGRGPERSAAGRAVFDRQCRRSSPGSAEHRRHALWLIRQLGLTAARP